MQQLVIQFPLDAAEPDNESLELLYALEESLNVAADGRFDVDGHDAGAGEMNIFIIADDARATLKIIEAMIPGNRPWRAGFRDLDADDYVPLAPAGLATFEVK